MRGILLWLGSILASSWVKNDKGFSFFLNNPNHFNLNMSLWPCRGTLFNDPLFLRSFFMAEVVFYRPPLVSELQFALL